jgi:hypothetical protein
VSDIESSDIEEEVIYDSMMAAAGVPPPALLVVPPLAPHYQDTVVASLVFQGHNQNCHPVLQNAINNNLSTAAVDIFPQGDNPRTGRSFVQEALRALVFCQAVAACTICNRVLNNKYLKKGKRKYLCSHQNTLVAICCMCTMYGWDQNFTGNDTCFVSRCREMARTNNIIELNYWNDHVSLLIEWILYKSGKDGGSWHPNVKFSDVMQVDYQNFRNNYKNNRTMLEERPVWSKRWAASRRFTANDSVACSGHNLDILLLLDQICDIADRVPPRTRHYVHANEDVNQLLAINVHLRLY